MKAIAFASAVAIGVCALFGFIHCSDDKSVTPLPATDMEVHEWGVLVGCAGDQSSFMTARPEIASIVREPVIYVHSEDKISFSASVRFNIGYPSDTYPEATVIDKFVIWNGVEFVDDLAPAHGNRSDHVPLEEIIDDLNDVDANCITYRDQTARFLFYEGTIPFENRVQVDYSVDSMAVTFRNDGEHPVYQVMISGPTALYTMPIACLEPGESAVADLVAIDDTQMFKNDLVSLGFTEREADAFANLWRPQFLYAGMQGPAGPRSNLIYRLSPDEYDDMISLYINPAPARIIRSLYVLVHL